jgi:hypothetical protein
MSSPSEQYVESVRKSQQAVLDAIETWTKSAQSALSAPSLGVTGQKTDQVIDQVFDFAEQMLAVQRQFAKNLAAIGATDQSKP